MGQQTPLPSIAFQPSATNGTTQYMPFSSSIFSGSWAATESDVQQPIPCAGTIDYLLVNSQNASGAGASAYTITLRKGAVDQVVTCVLGSNATTASDLTHSISVAAGDLVNIKVVTGATAAALGDFRWHFRFTANNSKQSVIFGGCFGTKQHATLYMGPGGCSNALTTTETFAQGVVPTGGTCKNLYTNLSDSAVADIIAVTLNLTGTPQTLSATYTTTASKTANDTTHSVAVVAGDRLSMSLTFTSGVTNTNVMWGMEFDPTTDGESVSMYCATSTTIADNSTRFVPVVSGGAPQSTEAFIQSVIMACTVKSYYIRTVGSAIPSGTSISTVRKGGVNQTLAATITSSNNANDTTHSFTTVDGDLLSVGVVTSGIGSTTQSLGGMVFYIAPSTIIAATFIDIDNSITPLVLMPY